MTERAIPVQESEALRREELFHYLGSLIEIAEGAINLGDISLRIRKDRQRKRLATKYYDRVIVNLLTSGDSGSTETYHVTRSGIDTENVLYR